MSYFQLDEEELEERRLANLHKNPTNDRILINEKYCKQYNWSVISSGREYLSPNGLMIYNLVDKTLSFMEHAVVNNVTVSDINLFTLILNRKN